MRPDILRLVLFLAGLFTPLSWELAAPHHAPTVSRPHRWRVNLSLAALNGVVPAFWRFHRVHHTDLDLDVTSASRFHLGEVLISAAGKLAAVVTLGISPIGLVGFEVVMLLAAQFQHENLRVPLAVERVLWWTFVAPAMHRIHHRPDPADTDSNFGTLVTWWDRLFGTYRPRAAMAEAFGLEPYRDEQRLGLLAVLGLPFGGGSRTSSRQAGTG